MTTKFEQYRLAQNQLPDQTWTWNMYGQGLENIGRDGQPEPFALPEPNAEQMLVRVDSVSICFSDVKLIQQGGNHPKLYDRDLAQNPTRLGHEVTVTVVEVGQNLQDQYQPGQRFAVQPDIYQNGQSTAYGYTIPGGLTQYHLMGAEMLETDAGTCLLPLTDEMGYAEASLLEPWGCVMAAYTQRRRLEPKVGGLMWVVGQANDNRVYQFSMGLDAPSTIILTDVPDSVAQLAHQTEAAVIIRNELQVTDYAQMAQDLTGDRGFDDIVVLGATSATAVSQIARLTARRGTMNLVGQTPLDGNVSADMGRLHYDYIAFIGTTSHDIAEAYGEKRNRCELRSGGTAVFVGAGGPMGQMHIQRAIQQPHGPRVIIGTEINDKRLKVLQARFAPLAQQNGRQLHFVNPQTANQSLRQFVFDLTNQHGADDVIVSVPHAGLMAEAATLLNPDGMLVLFAGVPNGTMAPLNLSHVYLGNTQITGTSGLTIHDQALVMEQAVKGTLSPARAVAAIGGLDAARDALQATMTGHYPGKIVIFPQIKGLPLIGLDELGEKLPDIATKLAPDQTWTRSAETALLETYGSSS